MTTLQRKKVHGNYYWYIVESRRVGGKPRPLVLAYLGKAKDLLNRLSGAGAFEVSSKSHGATQVLLNLAGSLKVADIINRHVAHAHRGKIPRRDGLSVGESLVLAALGRACRPTSKLGWYEWCKDSSLEYLLKRKLHKLDSQHFWDQMHTVPLQAIAAIECEIVQALSRQWPLATEQLFFDTTNFFTFIDSENRRCDMPQRGHNKQKRRDLRQISLALVVTGKDHIPIFHHLYDGNKNDITAFKENCPEVFTRLKALGITFDNLTLIFDKGNNSKANFDAIPDGVHFVGSLSPSHFRGLIEKANAQLEKITIDERDILAFRTSYEVWGKTRTCIVFISDELLSEQLQGIYQALQKATKSLDALQQRLQNPRHRATKEHLQESIDVIVDTQYLKHILKIEITSHDAHLALRYWVDLAEFNTLKEKTLGRQILVTTREAWSTEDIIRSYQRKTKIEYAFRCLKDHDHLSLRPQFHWTDQKLVVHAFICVLAFLLATAAYAKARKEAAYQHDLPRFLDDLARIRLAAILQCADSARGRPKISYKIETTSDDLRPLMQTFAIRA
jgi:transposase